MDIFYEVYADESAFCLAGQEEQLGFATLIVPETEYM
jgi:hypothetical protein